MIGDARLVIIDKIDHWKKKVNEYASNTRQDGGTLNDPFQTSKKKRVK